MWVSSGIAMMKLVAWADRGEARPGRDAVDFLEVLRQHEHVLTEKELYDDYPEAMEAYDFRVELAAAWILGKQVVEQIDDRIKEVIQETLQPESRIRMLNHFLKEKDFQETDSREAEAALLLDAFERGFQS